MRGHWHDTTSCRTHKRVGAMAYDRHAPLIDVAASTTTATASATATARSGGIVHVVVGELLLSFDVLSGRLIASRDCAASSITAASAATDNDTTTTAVASGASAASSALVRAVRVCSVPVNVDTAVARVSLPTTSMANVAQDLALGEATPNDSARVVVGVSGSGECSGCVRLWVRVAYFQFEAQSIFFEYFLKLFFTEMCALNRLPAAFTARCGARLQARRKSREPSPQSLAHNSANFK